MNKERQRLIDAIEDLNEAEEELYTHQNVKLEKTGDWIEDERESAAYYRKSARLRGAVDAARKSVLEESKKAFPEIFHAFFRAQKWEEQEAWNAKKAEQDKAGK